MTNFTTVVSRPRFEPYILCQGTGSVSWGVSASIVIRWTQRLGFWMPLKETANGLTLIQCTSRQLAKHLNNLFTNCQGAHKHPPYIPANRRPTSINDLCKRKRHIYHDMEKITWGPSSRILHKHRKAGKSNTRWVRYEAYMGTVKCVYSVFLPLPQRDIKSPRTFKFVNTKCNFIIFSPFKIQYLSQMSL
jgi:hypothetical protein